MTTAQTQTAAAEGSNTMTTAQTQVAERKTLDLGPNFQLAEDVKNLPSVPGAMAIQSTDSIQPVRPDHVTDEQDAELRQQAQTLAEAILANPSDIQITANIYALGQNAQSANTNNIALMDARIGPVLKEIGVESSVGKNLTQIKAQLDLVNPHVVGQTPVSFTDSVTKPRLWGLLGKRIVNEVVVRLPAGREEVMRLINERRDTIRSTIESLQGHLWTERDKALQNAIQLGLVANKLADAQDQLQESVYQGQLIWAHLNEGRAKETDPVRKQALEYLTADLGLKVVDLQTVDQLNIQARMGAETLINNCRGLQQLVYRVTNMLLPSVQTALVTKAGALQQAQLAEASRGIMAAASDTIAQTAKDIRNVSVAVAKMNTEALVDLDKLEEAANEFEQMTKEVNEVMQNAERNARGVSNRLNALNDRMRKTADPLTEARRAKEAAGV